jgi:hypothetical protein
VDVDIQAVSFSSQPVKARDQTPFSTLFCNILKDSVMSFDDIPASFVSATRMLRYLYDMALDNLDK